MAESEPKTTITGNDSLPTVHVEGHPIGKLNGHDFTRALDGSGYLSEKLPDGGRIWIPNPQDGVNEATIVIRDANGDEISRQQHG